MAFHRRVFFFVPLGLALASFSGGVALAAAPATGPPPREPAPATPVAAPPASPAVEPVPPSAPGPPLLAAAPAPPDPAIADLKRELAELKQQIEEQRALAEAGNGDDAVAKEAVLRIYGWADMGMNKIWVAPHDSLHVILPTEAATFLVGNINFYFDLQPTENWSSLIEVRFTNLPDGADFAGIPGTPYKRTSTYVNDFSAPIPWSFVSTGSIILPRAYIQYRHSDALQIRVGQFLTPFGIWNVDHGTPTLIALALPVFMIHSLFPVAQVGVQALGSVHAGDWEIGYTGYVSNGRTPAQVDPTDDKMFGGRLTARTSRPWRMQLGLSALTGRFSDIQRTVTGFAPFSVRFDEVIAYREVDVGLDLSLDIGRLRLRSELSRGQYVYETGKRPVDYTSPAFGKLADSVQLDWYGLAAYRLPWLNLEPFLYFEVFRWPTGLGQGYVTPSAGLNVYFTPAAQLRIQYVRDYFYKEFSGLVRAPEYDKSLFTARLVLGF
jgi:hypothetical protein